MERADTRCVLCNSERRALLYQQGHWSVYRCSDCGLGILDPRSDQNERDALYQSSYFQEQYDKGLEPGSSEMKRRLSHEDHRVRFFRGIKKRGRLLDIGCGMGYFLLACRNYGYHVEGI
ncbi:MAG: methyltransferase domain-containing protein [Syntrophales bacterium]|jgi:2-polyprenyl-3-methyl-5-hydroxy-6-metoxy-1,4-benzoquinol methylase